MKKTLLLLIMSASSMQADISYTSLYGKTAAIAGTLGGAGYLFSQLCKDKSNAPFVQGAFGALGIIAGAYYYNHWHPENRMCRNQSNFSSILHDPLLLIIAEAFQGGESMEIKSLMDNLLLQYVEMRNPFYDAFQGILTLKRQGEAILNESRLLLKFYSFCNRNAEYCTILERQMEEVQPIIALATLAMVAVKNTQEYKEALALQIEIEKQEALDRIARAEQTQAINSCFPSTTHVSVYASK